MKLIIWLWNPWTEYKTTKHNLGFLFLDYLCSIENFEEFKEESKFKWCISSGLLNLEKTLLLKPLTYMNLSWESIRKVVDFYKIESKDIIIIYDDLSMEFWKIRFREIWSAWGHNWVKSIISHFWERWKRIKVWISFNEAFDVSDWVLSKFNKSELDKLEKIVFPEVLKLVKEKL